MGHEGFYNSLLVAMGNVVSAILMYALQAAWLCQRLIDQDYRQNHGSRLNPISDKENISLPVEILSSPKSPASKMKCQRQTGKGRKVDTSKYQYQSEWTQGHDCSEKKRRRHHHHHHHHHQHQHRRHRAQRPANWSHPYLEDGFDSLTTTFDYVNGLGSTLGLRRAFSDINISSGCSKTDSWDTNQNYLRGGNIDEMTLVSVSDPDFLRLIFNKGYVT